VTVLTLPRCVLPLRDFCVSDQHFRQWTRRDCRGRDRRLMVAHCGRSFNDRPHWAFNDRSQFTRYTDIENATSTMTGRGGGFVTGEIDTCSASRPSVT